MTYRDAMNLLPAGWEFYGDIGLNNHEPRDGDASIFIAPDNGVWQIRWLQHGHGGESEWAPPQPITDRKEAERLLALCDG